MQVDSVIADRKTTYSMQFFDPAEPGVPWDYFWDGSGTPSNMASNHMRFDCSIDDDADEYQYPTSGYVIGPGYYVADRATRKHGFAANIWTRDTWLSSAAGLTLELRGKIHANSNPRAFSINYFDESGALALHINYRLAFMPPEALPCEIYLPRRRE